MTDDDARPLVALVGAGGWIGRHLGPSMLRSGAVAADQLVGIARSGPSEAYAAWPELRWERDLGAVDPVPDIVILSVRPQDFRSGVFRAEGSLVISMMAGVGATEIAERTGAVRVVRTMPNATVELGRCFMPWHAPGTVETDDRSLVTAVLSSVGSCAEVAREADVDAVGALSGTGHAYPALLAGALLAAARSAGLSEEVAVRTVENIVCDAGELLRGRVTETGAIVEQFMDYRGVTAAALVKARELGFDEAVQAAIRAGIQRSSEPGW